MGAAHTDIETRPMSAYQEAERRYETALKILACSCLAEPWSFYQIDGMVKPEMMLAGSDVPQWYGKIILEAQKQYRKHGKYAARTIAVENGLGGLNSDLLALAQEGAEVELRFAFDKFFEIWGQRVEIDLCQQIPRWIADGKTSEEVVVLSEEYRRKMGLSKLDSTTDGKEEFEAKLIASYEGKEFDYPVKPHLDSLRKLVPYYEPGDYIVVGALTGNGKSYYALNQLHYLALQGIPSTYINLENTPANVQKRLWQMEMGGKFHDNMSKRGDDEIKRGMETWERVKKMPIRSINPGRTLASVVAVIRQEWYERGIQFAALDYAQLMSIPGYRGGRNYELGEISAVLRYLALELKIPIMALAQLKQEVSKTGDKRGGLYDIKDCANFAQDATYAQFLYRPEFFEIKEDPEGNVYPPGYADVFIGKGRETGAALCEARFDPVRGFYDVEQEFTMPAFNPAMPAFTRKEPDTPF